MSGLSRDDVIGQALSSLHALLGRRPEIESELESAHFHDWQADPFSRGAYSFVLVDGEKARKSLAEPISDTLFFAGEATDFEGEAGTVAGAIQSGRRAAREIIGG